MAGAEIEELVVHLKRNMDLSTMEQRVKLILMERVWREIDIKWVKGNSFIITIHDESTTTKILDQVPWAVMNQNFAIKRWAQKLDLEEVKMDDISFWIQIKGVRLI
ncbi:hypothetical protein ACFX2G_019483 [Malus domestica]